MCKWLDPTSERYERVLTILLHHWLVAEGHDGILGESVRDDEEGEGEGEGEGKQEDEDEEGEGEWEGEEGEEGQEGQEGQEGEELRWLGWGEQSWRRR
eukprot:2196622-Prymnesium_polylepis.1